MLSLLISALLVATPAPTGPEGQCQAAPEGRIINGPGGPIFVRTIGEGRPILMIPSLARGSHDFDILATALAAKGYQSILPDPRATGASTSASAKDLFDLAADNIAVIQTLCTGPVVVLGHAFGNRVARSVATAAPDRVTEVILLAGGGEAPPTPLVTAALTGSLSEGMKPDAERLKDLRIAFFAKGNDASVWLRGWYPKAALLERKAGGATVTERWWRAGSAPVLLVQALEDPVAPPSNAAVLKRDLGDRLTLVALPHASHAMLPEQPAAIAAVLIQYLNGERDERAFRATIASTISPGPPSGARSAQ